MLSVTASVVPGPGTSPVVPPACGLQAWIWGSRDMKSRRGPFVFARWQPCLLGVAVTAGGHSGTPILPTGMGQAGSRRLLGSDSWQDQALDAPIQPLEEPISLPRH